MADKRVTIRLEGLPSKYTEGSLSHYLKDKAPIPTGSSELDEALSGGWPRHEVIYIQGDPASGKSSLCEETAVRFLKSGGDLVVFASLQGEHPLPGFAERVPDGVLIVTATDLPSVFKIVETILSSRAFKDVLVIVDDLPSLLGGHVAYMAVSQALTRIRRFLRSTLTLMLVNQTREFGGEEYGASAYRQAYRVASVAVHIGEPTPIGGEPPTGFTARATFLAPERLTGDTRDITVVYGRGVV